jgi:peptidoglycan hydrolase-like protein with peptidoglycan-binding domain
LASGDVGERVRRLQLRLIELRLLDDVADGRFGPNTGNAVIDFQFLIGLEPTAIVDDSTAAALGLT